MRLSQQAHNVAAPLRFIEAMSHARMWIGVAKLQRGEISGTDDLLQSVALVTDAHSPDALIVYSNVAEISEMPGSWWRRNG
jgi:hypothetical protein